MYRDYNGEKLNTLRKWLMEYQGYDAETVKENTGYNDLEDTYFFKITGKEYFIADDEEIFIDCYDYVLNNADTFSTDFILNHVKNWNPELRNGLDYLLSLVPMGEGDINTIILALIGDYSHEHSFDKFVSDAIDWYGAENFLGDYACISNEYYYNIFEDLYLSNQ